MASMFASAKKLAAPSSKAKKEKVQIEIEGILDSSALGALIDQLSAVKKTIDSDIKSQMSIEFIRMGAEKKDRPKNFEGTDKGLATASCELRARSSTSPLSETEVEMLTEAGLPIETIETTVETFVINPEYRDDTKLLAKVEKALLKIGGFPTDFFLKQEGSKKSVVGTEAIETLFASGDAKKISELLPHVSVLAIKPKLNEKANAFEIVRKMLGLGEKAEKEKEAA